MDFGDVESNDKYNRMIREITEEWYTSLFNYRKIAFEQIYNLYKTANAVLIGWISMKYCNLENVDDPMEKERILRLRTRTKSDILRAFEKVQELIKSSSTELQFSEIEKLEMMVGMVYITKDKTKFGSARVDEILPKSNDTYTFDCECKNACTSRFNKATYCTNSGFQIYNCCYNDEMVIEFEKKFEVLFMKRKILGLYLYYMNNNKEKNKELYNDLTKEMICIDKEIDSMKLEIEQLKKDYFYKLNLNMMPKQRRNEIDHVRDYFKRLSQCFYQKRDANNDETFKELLGNNSENIDFCTSLCDLRKKKSLDVFLPFIHEYFTMNTELTEKEIDILNLVLSGFKFWNVLHGFQPNFTSMLATLEL